MKIRMGNVLRDGRCNYCDRYQDSNDSVLVLTGNYIETRFCDNCLDTFKEITDK